MELRSLTTIAEFKQVVELECEIWGLPDAGDAVPVPIFVVSVKRGGILLGAFDGGRMVAFVYSMAGIRDGRPTQWSHMLGVLEAYRGTHLGRALKLEQRRLAIERGIDLVEWTYDPLQAVNAHLNFRRLGVVADEYALDVYGDSPSPLHQGTETDRFIVQWWVRSPRVERALGQAVPGEDGAVSPAFGAPVVNTVEDRGTWTACTGIRLGLQDPALRVIIPAGFTVMQAQDPGVASAWRHATREIFTHYLGRGYHVVDFSLAADGRTGEYLLVGG